MPSAANPSKPALCGRFSRRSALTPMRRSFSTRAENACVAPKAKLWPWSSTDTPNPGRLRARAGNGRSRSIAAEAVADVERVVAPAVMIGLDGPLHRIALAHRRGHEVGLRARRDSAPDRAPTSRARRRSIRDGGMTFPGNGWPVNGSRTVTPLCAEIAGPLRQRRHVREARVGLPGVDQLRRWRSRTTASGRGDRRWCRRTGACGARSAAGRRARTRCAHRAPSARKNS